MLLPSGVTAAVSPGSRASNPWLWRRHRSHRWCTAAFVNSAPPSNLDLCCIPVPPSFSKSSTAFERQSPCISPVLFSHSSPTMLCIGCNATHCGHQRHSPCKECALPLTGEQARLAFRIVVSASGSSRPSQSPAVCGDKPPHQHDCGQLRILSAERTGGCWRHKRSSRSILPSCWLRPPARGSSS